MTILTATTAEQGFLAPTQKTSAAVILADNGQVLDNPLPVFKYTWTVPEVIIGVYASPTVIKAVSLTNAEQGFIHENVPLYAYRPGAIVNEVIQAQAVLLPNFKYTQLLADRQFIHDAITRAIPASLSDVINVHQVETLVRAILVLEGLNLAQSLSAKATYTWIVNELIRGHDSLLKFLGASFGESIFVHDALSPMYRPQPVVTDAINLTSVLANKLLLNVVANESIRVSPTQALKALYNGTLSEKLQVTAGYVAPGGNFSTWVMNTRTASITEYKNFVFNSFAQMGTKYLGAASDGLYELVGNTDNGANIVADIRSGFAQWAGSHLTMFKGVYLGVRGGGSYVLKIITTDGVENSYNVVAQDMRQTKIDIGKGLRAHYFAFELISTGQDFDLDNIEFVPLVVQRRV